jgi:adenine phosphoribosyltransferase
MISRRIEIINIKSQIPIVQNWPRSGVSFIDICGLLHHPESYETIIDWATNCCHNEEFKATSIVAVESRGFLFGSPIAKSLKIPLILVRKPGKLPGETHDIKYQTEYSTDSLSIQKSAPVGLRPIIIDDVLATGGTVIAVSDLLKTNFNVSSVTAVIPIALKFLSGINNCIDNDIDLHYHIVYE